MLIWMKKCLCKQACNILSHSKQRMAELKLNSRLPGKMAFGTKRRDFEIFFGVEYKRIKQQT